MLHCCQAMSWHLQYAVTVRWWYYWTPQVPQDQRHQLTQLLFCQKHGLHKMMQHDCVRDIDRIYPTVHMCCSSINLHVKKRIACLPVQVRTKSPIPARPPMVMGWAPLATAKRVISTNPRVIKAALALLPKPKPSEMPHAMASTFFRAPPSSTPV